MAGKEELKGARREIKEEITMKKIIAFIKNGRASRGTGSDGGRQVAAGPGEGHSGAFVVFARLKREGLGSESNLTFLHAPGT